MQAYQHDWKQHVLRLKSYFDRQGLQNVDPSGALTWNSQSHQLCRLLVPHCIAAHAEAHVVFAGMGSRQHCIEVHMQP